ncbi:sensor histidine kinase [Rehaibacterium terrae]|jgi:signal transduction histidine kinase|uniref:histidine kinase n=1 Tax=Rehaibacterium terrae TaxID=1341696 RepID=A0A7W7Y0J7_9GAMM|nr:HAMP domain-containing sensor histidine kinase [Rehaibacterium terrae]MBB5015863.1 signal transduction histidine kinase [Rehaibacterium terrae]
MTIERSGLRRKIWVAFILQVAAISFATILGVYGASAVLKHVLINRALQEEAAHFWSRYAADPGVGLPDTYNMKGHLVPPGGDDGHLPADLRPLPPGYHSLPRSQGGALVHVEDGPGGRLYLVFKQTQVDALAFWFGVVPLVLVLLVIYVIAWATYRMSRRAVSPIIWLSNIVRHWDPKRPDTTSLDPAALPVDVEGETLLLASSLHDFATRLESFVERERNFTRDASHELRTPITVIRMASDLLQTVEGLPASAQRSVGRIQAAVRDMEALVEAFLILAREGDVGLPDEDFVVNDVVRDEVDKVRPLIGHKPVALRIEESAAFALRAPARVFAVLFGNLLRNACKYTDQGEVVVRVLERSVEIEDTGIGMSEEELRRAFEPFYRGGDGQRGGHGIGLSIVRRLSERFGWPVTLESVPGRGTRACIRFPTARPLRE